MSDNLVLDMLRAIRGDLGEIKADIREIKERISVLEGGYATTPRRSHGRRCRAHQAAPGTELGSRMSATTVRAAAERDSYLHRRAGRRD